MFDLNSIAEYFQIGDWIFLVPVLFIDGGIALNVHSMLGKINQLCGGLIAKFKSKHADQKIT